MRNADKIENNIRIVGGELMTVERFHDRCRHPNGEQQKTFYREGDSTCNTEREIRSPITESTIVVSKSHETERQ